MSEQDQASVVKEEPVPSESGEGQTGSRETSGELTHHQQHDAQSGDERDPMRSILDREAASGRYGRGAESRSLGAYGAGYDKSKNASQPSRPGAKPVQRKHATLPGAFGQALQRKGDGAQASPRAEEEVQEVASDGLGGGGAPLPFADKIQASFGRHDISGIRAHIGGDAKDASEAMGAKAYATGSDVAFASAPDLHTAAHEAAHVVQQRSGVSLKGGVGQEGDPYELNADAVADKVVAGKSAEGLLDQMVGGGDAGGGGDADGGVQRKVVQRKSESDGQGDTEPPSPKALLAQLKLLAECLGHAATDVDQRKLAAEVGTTDLDGLSGYQQMASDTHFIEASDGAEARLATKDEKAQGLSSSASPIADPSQIGILATDLIGGEVSIAATLGRKADLAGVFAAGGSLEERLSRGPLTKGEADGAKLEVGKAAAQVLVSAGGLAPEVEVDDGMALDAGFSKAGWKIMLGKQPVLHDTATPPASSVPATSSPNVEASTEDATTETPAQPVETPTPSPSPAVVDPAKMALVAQFVNAVSHEARHAEQAHSAAQYLAEHPEELPGSSLAFGARFQRQGIPQSVWLAVQELWQGQPWYADEHERVEAISAALAMKKEAVQASLNTVPLRKEDQALFRLLREEQQRQVLASQGSAPAEDATTADVGGIVPDANYEQSYSEPGAAQDRDAQTASRATREKWTSTNNTTQQMVLAGRSDQSTVDTLRQLTSKKVNELRFFIRSLEDGELDESQLQSVGAFLGELDISAMSADLELRAEMDLTRSEGKALLEAYLTAFHRYRALASERDAFAVGDMAEAGYIQERLQLATLELTEANAALGSEQTSVVSALQSVIAKYQALKSPAGLGTDVAKTAYEAFSQAMTSAEANLLTAQASTPESEPATAPPSPSESPALAPSPASDSGVTPLGDSSSSSPSKETVTPPPLPAATSTTAGPPPPPLPAATSTTAGPPPPPLPAATSTTAGPPPLPAATSTTAGPPPLPAATSTTAGPPPLPAATSTTAGPPPLPAATSTTAGPPPLPPAVQAVGLAKFLAVVPESKPLYDEELVSASAMICAAAAGSNDVPTTLAFFWKLNVNDATLKQLLTDHRRYEGLGTQRGVGLPVEVSAAMSALGQLRCRVVVGVQTMASDAQKALQWYLSDAAQQRGKRVDWILTIFQTVFQKSFDEALRTCDDLRQFMQATPELDEARSTIVQLKQWHAAGNRLSDSELKEPRVEPNLLGDAGDRPPPMTASTYVDPTAGGGPQGQNASVYAGVNEGQSQASVEATVDNASPTEMDGMTDEEIRDFIKATDVVQATIGDCFILSVLSSVAEREPSKIKSAIKEVAPGQFSVRLFVPSDLHFGSQQMTGEWIDVGVSGKLSNDFNRVRHEYKRQVGQDGVLSLVDYADPGLLVRELWPAIMEKALVKVMSSSALLKATVHPIGGGSYPLVADARTGYDSAHFGMPSWVHMMLLGEFPHIINLDGSHDPGSVHDQVWNSLSTMQNQSSAIIAGTGSLTDQAGSIDPACLATTISWLKTDKPAVYQWALTELSDIDRQTIDADGSTAPPSSDMLIKAQLQLASAAQTSDNVLHQAITTRLNIPVVMQHAYSVLEAYEEGQERLIRMRNPHGMMPPTGSRPDDRGDAVDGGSFIVSLQQFVSLFKVISGGARLK